ncbi:lipid A biosynthesis lauroyl acyltransferase [Piscirickettsia salmonis]|uniref:lysophospholipid acyltransferase family protein n=1 Tax=Piscirickettsia salmonis TaxID=1238 RepID=UPI0012BB19FA|nr:lysophospholipid acyltransferase family protein [Piscirickettsia salmonis]QGP53765.1 lipid A biosynthesis lauroyl acyltransferase [Piscirickettsia salmonis]QGP60325.1 lipid A biosynthesis lauroyl acyltransferase [Piscirickettsia salmonis]QGP63349.1 lipid A biosynthesis lauroyl acyltransferase [Piscirickettsia salmonis]
MVGKNKFSDRLAYGALLFVVWLTRILGVRMTNRLLFPVLYFLVAKKRFNFMMDNIMQSLPGKSADEYKVILKNSLRHTLTVMLINIAEKKFYSEFVVKNEHLIDDIVKNDEKGAIIVTAHYGNWEALSAFFRSKPELTVGAFYNQPANRYIDRFLIRMRKIRLYPAGQGIKKALLKEYKVARRLMTIVVIDQRPKKHGLKVNLFNRPASISPVAVKMALQAQVPIIVVTTPVIDGKTHIHLEKIEINQDQNDSLDKARKVQNALQMVMDRLAAAITCHPEQWMMWSHNFWK